MFFICRFVMSGTISVEKDILFFLTPICLVAGSCFIYAICIYLRIVVSNTIFISDDVRVV
jgi:hypothetical protein